MARHTPPDRSCSPGRKCSSPDSGKSRRSLHPGPKPAPVSTQVTPSPPGRSHAQARDTALPRRLGERVRRRKRFGGRPPEHALQRGRHDHVRSAREAEGLPAPAVLGEPRVLLLRGHAARSRPGDARLHRSRALQGGEREVQGPDQDRRRRRHLGVRRRSAVRDRGDRLQGGSAGRHQDHLELQQGLERRRCGLDLVVHVLGSRRAAAAVLRGHARERSRSPIASSRSTSRRTTATSSRTRSA